jgi:hypothetical protein
MVPGTFTHPAATRPAWMERMARATGLEPATPGVTGRYSNRLSYARAIFNLTPESLSKAGVIPPTHHRVKAIKRSLCRIVADLLSVRLLQPYFEQDGARMATLKATSPCTVPPRQTDC